MADTPITVPVGSFSFNEETLKFANSGDMKLIFTGYAPLASVKETISPDTVSLSLTGEAPIRAYGLQFLSDAPSLKIDRFITPATGALQISSDVVTPLIAIPASSHVVAPSRVDLNFSSDAPTVNIIRQAFPTLGTISFSSAAPTIAVGKSIFIFRAAITTIQSDAPTVSVDYVGGSPGDGTLIQNLDADTDPPVSYTICDRTGFKIKPYRDPLVQDPYGNYVRAESSDKFRHPQERVKSTSEDLRTGAKRPEPVGSETFIGWDEGSPVDPDDL